MASKRKRFAETRIGYAHFEICELPRAQGRLFIFLPIDRVAKFAHVAFFGANTKVNGAAFLREVLEVFLYRLHTVLIDNSMAVADLPKNRGRYPAFAAIASTGPATSTASRTDSPKLYHPWTNGQAERMNRTIKGRRNDPAVGAGYVFAFARAVLRASYQGVDSWSGGAAAFAVACSVLDLDIGPIHRNLLELVIDLSAIHFDIAAIPGGGLLGDFLCALANLL